MASTNNGELRMAVADRRSYLTKSYLLLGLCLADIGLNSFADHFHRPDEGRFYPMVLIGLQFLVQVLNLLTLSMLFFGTYVVQVGLLNLLLRNFRVECFIIPAYFVIFLVYAAIKSFEVLGEKRDRIEIWDEDAFIAVFMIQKLGCDAGVFVYYAAILFTIVKLGQSKWYIPALWINQAM